LHRSLLLLFVREREKIVTYYKIIFNLVIAMFVILCLVAAGVILSCAYKVINGLSISEVKDALISSSIILIVGCIGITLVYFVRSAIFKLD